MNWLFDAAGVVLLILIAVFLFDIAQSLRAILKTGTTIQCDVGSMTRELVKDTPDST